MTDPARITIYACRPKTYTIETMNDITWRTLPSEGDYVIAKIEAEVIVGLLGIYVPGETAPGVRHVTGIPLTKGPI